MRKHLSLLISSFFVLFAAPINTQASHFAADDLTYECLGGNTYRITLSFYRDCSGLAAAGTVNITFNCASDTLFNFNIWLQRISNTGQEITPGCSAVPTRCSIGTSYGIREYVYQGIVQLAACANWLMSYSDCCRNPSNTIFDPTTQSYYLAALLNNLVAPCNSSPYFTNKPITIICSGQTMCYSHGAIDPDGDSLSYSLVDPMTTDINSYVTYISGYSAQQPLPSNPPVSINPVTGDICMTPTVNIVSPMAVRVDSWRKINNVWINVGTVFRDIQVNVVSCSNTIPVLSGMDTTLSHIYNPNDTTYFIDFCFGPTVNFTIKGHDADTYNASTLGSPHIFFLSWNQGIPGGTFNTYHNGTDSAYAQFTWTPNVTHVSNTPKCFTVSIHDQACPYYGIQAFSYCITVRGMFVDIGSDTLLCKGESLTFNANADTTTVNYIWKLDGNPTGTLLSSTTYTLNTSGLSPGIHVVGIETNDGTTTLVCPGIDNVNVNVYQPNVNLGPDTNIHPGNYIILNAGPGFTSYQWSSGETWPIITVDSSGVGIGTKIISVQVTDSSSCVGSDTILLNFHYFAGFENLTTGNERFVLYPVPVTGKLLIETEGYGMIQCISIYDAGGRKVLDTKVNDVTSRIDVSMLSPGIYVVQAMFADTILRRKIIIANP